MAEINVSVMSSTNVTFLLDLNGLKMIAVYFRVIHKQNCSAVSVQFMMFWFGSVGNLMLALGLSARVGRLL